MFSNMRIKINFQPELQLMFRYMAVSVKPGFMAMSFSITLSQKLVAKSRLCYNIHALL